MTKWALILIVCSLENNVCIPPFEWKNQFNDSYDCMIKGYEESIKKTIEVGRDQVNNVGLYIKFSCTPIETI